MKKSIILKSFLVILVCAMLVFTGTSVYAAVEDDGIQDLTGDSSNNSSDDNNTNSNKSNNSNNSGNSNKANNSSNVNNASLNAIRNNASNNVNTNNLPKTGIEDSLPTVLLLVVFGISAVYAYKKVKDYRNID